MSFREKIDSSWNFVAHMVGLPTQNNLFKKYLLDIKSGEEINFPKGLKIETHFETDRFLKAMNNKMQIKLAKSGDNDMYRYTYSCRIPSKNIN